MSLPDRKEAEVRRLLVQRTAEPVPADLAERALADGARLLRRRRVLRTVLWGVVLAGLLALTAWSLAARPWSEPPPTTTPPAVDW
ncbi:hypothetical protein [Streptomyces spirodelae]|uniref:DUF3040 domain-containing protein n=1 Tax=Streptomyces spirodelae TaxID=2812904 RepID=A0ABS3WWT9_9ACTN|nr:hypothetical protein [Streptomyces spirodelae]MBO8187609.1 hypothetical protein [Streptomyces spirodelae]